MVHNKHNTPGIIKYPFWQMTAKNRQATLLISKSNRYDIKGRKYIGANLKYYFTDVGLRNARLNFRQQEPTHIMENIVYNELLIRGYNVDTGIIDVYGKNKEGKRIRKQLEVDFVVNQGSQRYFLLNSDSVEF